MADILAKDTSDIDWSDVFDYSEQSPTGIIWAVNRYSGKYHQVLECAKGSIAGGKSSKGYYVVNLNGRVTLCHRVIWEMFNPPLKITEFIDHINGERADNRVSNLRIATKKSNARNRVITNANKTGAVGVCKRDIYDINGKYNTYYIAQWVDLDGKRKSANFNVKQYGEAEAFKQACNHRAAMIAKLNEQGAGYTERHGT